MLKIDTNSDLLLRLHYFNEDEEIFETFLKVYSNYDCLESSKEYHDETPIHIEIAEEDSYINNGNGISLTVQQTKELIDVLQQAIEYLER